MWWHKYKKIIVEILHEVPPPTGYFEESTWVKFRYQDGKLDICEKDYLIELTEENKVKLL